MAILRTIYIITLGRPGQNIPQRLILCRVPLNLEFVSQKFEGQGGLAKKALAGGGSTKSPLGNGSRMKTVNLESPAHGSAGRDMI